MVTKQFLLAGKAIFTFNNDKGEHYTYKVTKGGNSKPIWFVSLLTSPDIYTYMGIMFDNGIFRLTGKSKYEERSKPVLVFKYALKLIWNEQEPMPGYGLNHAGNCGRCGKTLTRPEGIASDGFRFGFGPDCWKIICAQHGN